MKFTGNYTIENGKFEATYSADLNILGVVVRVKELELQGDINELMDSFSAFAGKETEDRYTLIISSIAAILGVKPEVADRFLDAVMSLK